METKKLVSTLSMLLSGFTLNAYAINNAPADADSVTLRTSCTQGGTEITNCFTTMAEVNNWLLNVRQPSAIKPTIIDIGPGTFQSWKCTSSGITLRGSGRDKSTIKGGAQGFGMEINQGCTNLTVQDLTVNNANGFWGVTIPNISAITSWTNVEIIGGVYGWVEWVTSSCANHDGKHLFFSSRIISTGAVAPNDTSRAYTATCAQSWFWGSEITSQAPSAMTNMFALEAHGAEVHLYGSNVRLLLPNGSVAASYIPGSPSTGNSHYMIAALNSSAIHIHGTGLDVVHPGSGTADMLYADSTSHFHANESGFNIHVSGEGKVRRVAGAPNRIEAPYIWKQGTQPPLSTKLDGTATYYGVQTLISESGADSYIETDCPVSGNCSLGGTFPHQMIYRAECTNTTANEGPWFDLTTKDCRK